MSRPIDPLHLTQALIRAPSITPADAGALSVLEAPLRDLGFACERMPFGEVDNLWALRPAQGKPDAPVFCFAGHTDVVPPGPVGQWSSDPFEPTLREGKLYGRGAADMKGALAAMVAACDRVLASQPDLPVAIGFLITGDEEGPAVNGTVRMLEALQARGQILSHCLVGEPTNPDQMGQMIKNGRRGSVNVTIIVEGTQGHVAYPHLAANPIPPLLEILHTLTARHLDDGYPCFDPSNLEVTTIDVGNPASNVIPAQARARINIRFNPAHTGADLVAWIEGVRADIAARFAGTIRLESSISGEAFLTAPGAFTDLLQDAIAQAGGARPALSTTGGTSDARFIARYCPVAEYGLVGASIHKIDEHTQIDDLETLTCAYRAILEGYAARFG